MLVVRRKLEIFVEPHARERIEAMLGASGFKGWSVFEGFEGSGAHGVWRQSGVDEKGLNLLIAIGDEQAAEAALTWLGDYFKIYPGIVSASDVEVMRAERF
ncbi:P-II family nitrogen regulator [Candidatus Viadribacter manganicus]|uniref:Nitrogen regulatory protein P-II n=1 Tax=Candidatus Viadribacter manganicus TaxID=1759059 RepID=A0A1B1AGL5_9PROT|nr:hypothetical protein [Candidatus Viadribacter manganicus]ANP45698.1 hypothetical protein ATE48_07080 [Candidatus Viadribacter manganicus]